MRSASANPRVMTRTVGSPLRSSSALVATVVPSRTTEIRSAGMGAPSATPSRRRIPATAGSVYRHGSSDSSLWTASVSSGRRATTSVKVPPRSIQNSQPRSTPALPRRLSAPDRRDQRPCWPGPVGSADGPEIVVRPRSGYPQGDLPTGRYPGLGGPPGTAEAAAGVDSASVADLLVGRGQVNGGHRGEVRSARGIAQIGHPQVPGRACALEQRPREPAVAELVDVSLG